jgi:ABC-2 type transport system permease protein
VTGTSFRRLAILIRRERRELLRDRTALAILVALPLVSLVLFTFALATDVRDLRLAVFDAADTTSSRAVVHAIGATGYFDVRRARSLAMLRRELAAGAVDGGVVIPPAGDARTTERAAPPPVQLFLDGSQALLAANADALLAATFAHARRDEPPGAGEPGRVRLRERALYNPDLDSAHYMIPGLLGYVFTFLTILVAAVSIVRERVGGTFEQLMMTPVRSHEIVAAKLAVLGVALVIDEGIVMVVGGLAFGVWPRGSVPLLVAVTGLYLMVTLAVGLAISAGSRTPDEAVQKSLVVATPLLNVSGLVFPVTSMPYGFQLVAQALPVYHYLRTARAIYLTGAGSRDVAPHVAVIAAYVGVLGVVLLRRLARERRA